MNDITITTGTHHGTIFQTVFNNSTYDYMITPVKSGNEGKPVVASRLNLPLETDGPATCLVYFTNTNSSMI